MPFAQANSLTYSSGIRETYSDQLAQFNFFKTFGIIPELRCISAAEQPASGFAVVLKIVCHVTFFRLWKI